MRDYEAEVAKWMARGVPKLIAWQQVRWEFDHKVLLAVEAGASQAEIARFLKRSRSMVSIYVRRAERDRRRKAVAPIIQYFNTKTNQPRRKHQGRQFRKLPAMSVQTLSRLAEANRDWLIV